MTPEDAANLAVNTPERRQWLLSASAPDIQRFIHAIADKPYVAVDYELARTALEVRIADDQIKSAEKLENHTRVLVDVTKLLLSETKLLRLMTVCLVILTTGLLIFAIRSVVSP